MIGSTLKALRGAERQGIMTGYQCLYLDVNGEVFASVDFDANTDEEAIAQARKLVTKHSGAKGFEVWKGPHSVYAEVPPAAR